MNFRRLRFFGYFIIIPILLSVFAYLILEYKYTADGVDRVLLNIKPYLAIWRVSIYILIFLLWDVLCDHVIANYLRGKIENPDTVNQIITTIKSRKWRYMAYILAIELVFIQRIF